jgi:hypothetical protein
MQGALGQLTRLAPQFLGRSGGSRGRQRSSSGPLGFLSQFGGGRGGRGGMPINGKALAGLLGAGAGGVALLRKRRAGRTATPQEEPRPDHPSPTP